MKLLICLVIAYIFHFLMFLGYSQASLPSSEKPSGTARTLKPIDIIEIMRVLRSHATWMMVTNGLVIVTPRRWPNILLLHLHQRLKMLLLLVGVVCSTS